MAKSKFSSPSPQPHYEQDQSQDKKGGAGRAARIAAGALVGGAVIAAVAKITSSQRSAGQARSGNGQRDSGSGHDSNLQPAGFASGEAGRTDNLQPVRSAGPEAMRDKPDKWDNVDQAMDESFPASDPPSNY